MSARVHDSRIVRRKALAGQGNIQHCGAVGALLALSAEEMLGHLGRDVTVRLAGAALLIIGGTAVM